VIALTARAAAIRTCSSGEQKLLAGAWICSRLPQLEAATKTLAVRAAMGDRLRSRFLSQFGKPPAPYGVAGLVMAYRGSNRRRNTWTVVNRPDPADEVLEIGLRAASPCDPQRTSTTGGGRDRSEVMRGRRCAATKGNVG
jgi:hypothetical protein